MRPGRPWPLTQGELDGLCGLYPSLLVATSIVAQREAVFPINSITDDEAERLVTEILASKREAKDPIVSAAIGHFESKLSIDDFKKTVITVLYQVGMLGVKLAPHYGV